MQNEIRVIEKERLTSIIKVQTKRYASFFYHAPIGYFTVRPDSTITHINLMGAKILKLKTKQLIHRQLITYVDKVHQANFRKFLARVFESTDNNGIEVLLVVENQIVWFNIEGSMGANTMECLITLTDINKQKKVKETFRRNNKLLQDIKNKFEHSERISNSVHWETDAQCKVITYISTNCESIFGQSPKCFIGNISDFENNIMVDDRLEISKLCCTQQSDPRHYEVEFRYLRDDGQLLWIREVGEPIFGNTGTHIGYRGTQHDITLEKENMFIQVQTSLKQYRELIFQQRAFDEHAIVSITDVAGNITHINDNFCAITGYSHEEILGKNHRIFKSDEHLDVVFASMWMTISSGQTWRGEIKNTNKDGLDYWCNVTIVPALDDKGKPYQYASFRSKIKKYKNLQQSWNT